MTLDKTPACSVPNKIPWFNVTPAEVEQTCTNVVVMNRGRLVAQGSVSDLVGTNGSVYVEVDDPAAYLTVPAAIDFQADWTAVPNTNEPVLQLALSDKVNHVTTYDWFNVSDLADEDSLPGRLEQLWGDFLQSLSHKQLEAISSKAGE